MKTFFGILTLAIVLYYVHAAPFEGDTQETSDANDKENESTVGSEAQEMELSPQQLGRLSRINGEFFQLYGELNEKNGNLDGITGNRLNFHGGLVEHLANEHTLRSIGGYIKQGQEYHNQQAETKSGRDAEIEKELGELFGKLSAKFGEDADIERNQAEHKQSQLAAESKIFKLADQEADLKGKETFEQLEIAEDEEDQIKVENSAEPIIRRIIALEEEQSKMGKGAATTESPM